MSRKTKEALNKERLEQISNCPVDLLNGIEPSEEFFAKIQAAEEGDVCVIRELSTLTYETYKNDCEMNQAMLYYAKLGMEKSDQLCAVNALKCVERFNERYDLTDEAISILSDAKLDDTTERLIARIKVQRIIHAVGDNADYDALANALSETCDEYSAYARLYVASHKLINTGAYDENRIDSLAVALDVPTLPTLPVFCGRSDAEKKAEPSDAKKECEAMRFASTLIRMDEWRDFWLRALYEYTERYLDGDLSLIAEDINCAVKMRCDYPERKLHLYAIESIISPDSEERKALSSECRFDGIDLDAYEGEALYETVREAVYTDSREQRLRLARLLRLGTEIKHVKNRYVIEAMLDNHMKRGVRHMWDVTLSIKTELETAPIIAASKISNTKNEVTRNGVTLDKERKLTQMFCRGELQLGEKMYPLEIDLILDISYVSSTKCDMCEIKIKSSQRDGEYLVMRSSISVY